MALAVSIHAPRVGCDNESIASERNQTGFNSRTPCGVRPLKMLMRLEFLVMFQFTHPVWGATLKNGHSEHIIIVSIHAPRVGCDQMVQTIVSGMLGFNSRTPCGVRQATPIRYRVYT